LSSQRKSAAYQRNAASFMKTRDAVRKLPAYGTLTNAARLQLDDILRNTLGRGSQQTTTARAVFGPNSTASRSTKALTESGLIDCTLVTGAVSTFSVAHLLRSINGGECKVTNSKKAKPSTSKLPVRKAPRIKSSAILQIDGVKCRSDDRKGITAALIGWHWEADDPARPEERDIVEMASEVEIGLGPEVHFSEGGVQRIFNSLSHILPSKSGSEYAAMLGNVIRKHYRG
jgi:hypothetical protein